jgi:membrane protein DedA with SNARE-associated domain
MPEMPTTDPTDSDDATGGAAGDRRRPPRRYVVVVGTLIGLLVIATNVGNIFITTLAEDRPALLLALNSTNRVLGLVTNQLDPVTFYLLGSARLLVSDPLFFLLGLWYGDAAIRWVERKSSSQGEMLRRFESAFDKAAYPVVFFAPNNIVCLLAGASRMPVGAFIATNLAGTLTRLFLIRQLGVAFASPIERLLGFFAEYRVPLLVLSAVLVLGSVAMDRKQGKDDLTAVRELDQELEALDEEAGGVDEGEDGARR